MASLILIGRVVKFLPDIRESIEMPFDGLPVERAGKFIGL